MNKKLLLILPIAAIPVLVFLIVGDFISGLLPVRGFSGSYQSATLANGTIYFGQIKRINKSYLVLEDVFYLRTVVPAKGGQTVSSDNQFELVKLGNELHGPRDRMTINRGQVLSVQDLKEDSKVVAAIKEYYRTKKAPSP